MSLQIDVVELARQIAVRMDPDALLDSEDCAALLKCSARNFMARFAPAPGFPKPYRLTTTEGRSQPRWKRSDLLTWINRHGPGGTTGRGGRPRNRDDD